MKASLQVRYVRSSLHLSTYLRMGWREEPDCWDRLLRIQIVVLTLAAASRAVLRIRIKHFRSEIRFRIQGFDDQKLNKIYS